MKKITLLSLFLCFLITVKSQEIINVSEDIELIRLSGNAYIHVSYLETGPRRYSSNGVIFVQKNEAFLFDTPPTDSLTRILCDYITEKLNLKIKGFVPNHWHEDCMGGLSYLKSVQVPSFASQKTIETARSKNLPVPDHGFKDSLELTLGDKKILCWFPGAAHSMDNIVVWIPSEEILFAGCMCKSTSLDNLGNTADGSLTDYASTIENVMRKFNRAKIVIPGHGAAGGIELLSHTLSLAEKQ